ncbi:DUF2791 family P-loop domain-containing protein [bacterium]|nr:DUF2791 family P-loop domain-containing protein [candidate division CSSED10-310 bacterium]
MEHAGARELTPHEARLVIEKVGASGEPPEYGARHFTAGIDPLLAALREEYLGTLLKQGISTFKLLVGDYGAGKTHFLYCLREVAWEEHYAVSLVALNPRDCPFDRLELVYRELVSNIMLPVRPGGWFDPADKGIEWVVEKWIESVMEGMEGLDERERTRQVQRYLQSLKRIESSSFRQAVRTAFSSYVNEETEQFDLVLAWLKGEPVDKRRLNELNIFERVDKTTAFRLIRSLCQWIREIGYSGLVLLFDEGERQSSISGSKSKKIAYDNLRQVVDECGHSKLPGTMFCYAVPTSFKEEIKAYEALRQRLLVSYPFSRMNPSSVEINLEVLENAGPRLLEEIGHKLTAVYELAFGLELAAAVRNELVQMLAQRTFDQVLDVSHRRIFVKLLIEALHLYRSRRVPLTGEEVEKLTHGVIYSLSEHETESAEGEW